MSGTADPLVGAPSGLSVVTGPPMIPTDDRPAMIESTVTIAGTIPMTRLMIEAPVRPISRCNGAPSRSNPSASTSRSISSPVVTAGSPTELRW